VQLHALENVAVMMNVKKMYETSVNEKQLVEMTPSVTLLNATLLNEMMPNEMTPNES